VAIDDFGTGYSSLGYLGRFPIDMLKVDRSFTVGLGNGPEESALARAIVKLGQSLELQVVAEGIENEDQLNELRRIRCDLGQGYFLARPSESEQASAWLEKAVAQRNPRPRIP
jgi:EAL domain-containing protein (putative c-di-GMP-specific phosphodiesterase class I)